MIFISKSENADTNYSKVDKEDLINCSKSHINDVKLGLSFLSDKIKSAGSNHDWSKLKYIDMFHEDFKTGFKTTKWWDLHQTSERHHLKKKEYVQEDVNLIDVLEMIVDGVMAGMARSGKYRKEEDITDKVLRKAYDNTISMLLNEVEVIG